MKAMMPEEELEYELEYHQRKKRKKPDKYYIGLWEAYCVLKDYVRDIKGYIPSYSDPVQVS